MATQEKKRQIVLDNGEQAPATFPVIVSASRSTDIPAFYADWFFHRLQKGYSAWTNPFNQQKYYVSYQDTMFIVFWSKNPQPLLQHLDYLEKRQIGCYIQFTFNDYEADKLEPGVPPLAERIETFRRLAEELGKGAVIWRFDPLILTPDIKIDALLARIQNIASQIHPYTEKLVFSFVDILSYRKLKIKLDNNEIKYTDWAPEQMREFAAKLVEFNKREGWNLTLATCGETAELDGIEHNSCVDERLILRLSKSPEVWKFLNATPYDNRANSLPGVAPVKEAREVTALGDGRYVAISKSNRDKGQREACNCAKSKDIGQYNTCPHLCEYCYANKDKNTALRNYKLHQANPDSETITGS